jgi:hypothetical protein
LRNKNFIAEHRGGNLTMEHHRKLIVWAVDCISHVLFLYDGDIDERILNALTVAVAWKNGGAGVGEAREASVKAHAAAREAKNPLITAIARASGHAVATAHMADHSLGAAEYALKALKLSGRTVEEERKWQNEKLEPGISEFVITERNRKFL